MHPSPLLMILAAASLLAAGCQAIAPPNWAKSWFTEEQPKLVESKYSRPVRLAVIWSPAMLNNPGGKPIRGFGGRIYFYDAQNNAVPVEGQLVVYGYNNSQPNADGKTPDRKYAFTPEQFTEHFSPTELGASYSIWIPWDEVGNEELEISLAPIFTATSGQVVVGQFTMNLLPGPKTENTATQFNHRSLSMSDMVKRPLPGPYGVQQASYLVPPTASNLPAAQQRSETTFRLPASLAERMAESNATAPLPATGTSKAIAEASAAYNRHAADNLAARENSGSPAAARQSSPTHQPSARFLRPVSPAPSSPAPPPIGGRLPTQPLPAG